MHPALICEIFLKFLRQQISAIIGLLFIATSGLFATSSTAAQTASRCDEPVFGAASIDIDQRAATAAEAREAGVDAGARMAFLQVLDRLLLADADQHTFATAHQHDAFTDFVHIIEEKNLEKRYIAKLDFCFDAERVRAALQADGLQWAELQSPPILLLPVWKDPGGASAWLRDNQWIAGWRSEVDSHNGLVDLRRLPHNLTHERRFRGDDLLAGDPIKLMAAARLAGAEQVMVVMAQLDYLGSKRVVDVEARLFDKVGQPITTVITIPKIELDKSDMKQLDMARRMVMNRVEGSWHGANLINSNAAGYLLANLPVTDAKQWSDRLDALRQVAVIESITIRTLDRRGGTVSLALAGSREALENALASQGLILIDSGNEISIVGKSEEQ
jgi:hypothetical protein